MDVKIIQFARSNLKDLHRDVEEALKAVAKKYSVNVEVSGGRFSPEEYRTKVTFTTASPTKWSETRREFDEHVGAYGLKSEDFGKEFRSGGLSYVICGIKPRSYKYPILCRQANNSQVYKFSASRVLQALGRKEAAELALFRETTDGREVDPELRAARRGLV